MNLPKRATISLSLIAKNEEKNIRRLLDSVAGCFDEIVLVDTGSTDKTKEIALEYGCKVYDFTWVNSFSKARNFSFSKTTSDYVMWMDLDDELHNREAFIKWRDYAMSFQDCFLATYHYALDKDKKPIISFVRERVFRKAVNPTWQYDLHEGIVPKNEWTRFYVTTWAINHMRDMEDIQADKSRNIKILEEIKDTFDGRMHFYYGKELYEAGRFTDAVHAMEVAIKRSDIEFHDKVLAYQYGSYAALSCFGQTKEEFKEERLRHVKKAIDFAADGIKLDPNRAELQVACGDAYLQAGDLVKSIPYFTAAKHCFNPKSTGSAYEGALYSFVNCYGELPSLQLSKVYFNIGQLEKAEAEAKECAELYKNQEALKIIDEIKRIKGLVTINNNQVETQDIVFTCPPNQAYPFDEEIYKTKPLGGSETALVQMAKYIKKFTGRPVKVFNSRDEDLIADSGVEYISNKKLNEYFSINKPAINIAWRHNIKITNAKTYLWCHDLLTNTVESVKNFDKILCLTPFHKNYVNSLQGVPEENIIVTRNGITPEKFNFERKPKNPNKFVWMSSPDRGLDRAINVCEEVRKEYPDVELHVYYGLENLYKYGLGALADHLKGMIAVRPWVKYHGFTEQEKMYQEVSDAVVWCHPCNFIETFCITAIEMLALGIFPVTRRLGALQDTLGEAESIGQTIMLDHDCITPEQTKAYANACCKVLQEKAWEKVSLNIAEYDWARVALEWIDFMGIK